MNEGISHPDMDKASEKLAVMPKDANEIYLDARASLEKCEQQAYQGFDKAILTLSSGGLALSLVFLKDVLHTGELNNRAFLIIVWISFASSLLLTLISFFTSQAAFKRQIEILDTLRQNDADKSVPVNPYSTATRSINYSSAFLFVIGVSCLVWFASINIGKEGTDMSEAKDAKTNQGQVPSSLNKSVLTNDLIKGGVPSTLPPANLFQQIQSAPTSAGNNAGQSSNGNGNGTPKKD